jgi:hypothetical protein
VTAEQSFPTLSIGVVTPDVLGSLSGLEFLQGIVDGRLPAPPIAALLGFRPAEIESGRAVFVSTPNCGLYNPIGSACLIACLVR